MAKPLSIALCVPAMLGYSRIVKNVLRGLDRLGVAFNAPDPYQPFDFGIMPPDTCTTDRARITKDTVIYTMGETTRLQPAWIAALNQARAVIVPSSWCASCFSAQGVTAKLYVCELGFDPEVFHPTLITKFARTNPFVFSTVFDPGIGMNRKGVDVLLTAFKSLKLENTELWIRSSRPVGVQDHEGVRWFENYLPDSEYADWIRTTDCGVFPSRGEGFGLVPLEYLACCTPIIVSRFGGLTEFVPYGLVQSLKVNFEKAKFDHRDNGHWAEPDLASLIALMVSAYSFQETHKIMAATAERAIHHMTWDNTAAKLHAILRSEELV